MSTATPARSTDPTRRRQAVAAWVLALPFMALFLVFTAGPVLASLGMSFTDIRSTDMRSPFAVSFVGVDNYTRLLGDPLFRKVMVNTGLYLVLGVPLTMALALLVALGLNRITVLRGLFRVGYYLPVVTSIVAVVGGLAVPAPRRGRPGQQRARPRSASTGPAWLDDHVAGAAVAGRDGRLAQPGHADDHLPRRPADHPRRRSTRPPQVDGAGRVAGRFRHVTLPMLRPTLLFGAVITTIGYLQFFEEPFVMTKGGPLDTTRSVTLLHLRPVRVRQLRGTPPRRATCCSWPSSSLTFLQFQVLRSDED